MQTVKFKGPENVTSVSVRGKQLEVTDGLVEVETPTPADIDALASHGFSVHDDSAEETSEENTANAQGGADANKGPKKPSWKK